MSFLNGVPKSPPFLLQWGGRRNRAVYQRGGSLSLGLTRGLRRNVSRYKPLGGEFAPLKDPCFAGPTLFT